MRPNYSGGQIHQNKMVEEDMHLGLIVWTPKKFRLHIMPEVEVPGHCCYRLLASALKAVISPTLISQTYQSLCDAAFVRCGLFCHPAESHACSTTTVRASSPRLKNTKIADD